MTKDMNSRAAAIFVFSILVCSPLGSFAVDDGGKCPICGKITMKGASHVCKRKKKFTSSFGFSSTKTSKDKTKTSIDDLEKKIDNEFGSAGSSAQHDNKSQSNALPRFSNYYVLGVAIVPGKETPQLVCLGRSYSDEKETEKMFPMSNHSEAQEYYQENIDRIPVLGVRGSDGTNRNSDDTINAAVEKLKADKAAAIEMKKDAAKTAKANAQNFNTPLTCLARNAVEPSTTNLVRQWTDKKSRKLTGIWIANYEAYNVKGIVIFGIEKGKLYKIPITTLSNDDVEYVHNENINSGVTRFDLKSISFTPESKIGQAFKNAGRTDSKILGVLFGMNRESLHGEDFVDEHQTFYVQLFPDGQVCEIPVVDTCEDVDHYRPWGNFLHGDICCPVIQKEDAIKGPAHILEKMYSAAVSDKNTKKRIEDAQRAEKQRRERIRPFVDEYKKLWQESLYACKRFNNTDPARYCEVHKWKEEFAPKFGGDAYTEQSKAQYGQNYMQALQLQKDGMLKCTCNDPFRVKKHREAAEYFEAMEKKLNDFKDKHLDIDFEKESTYYD